MKHKSYHKDYLKKIFHYGTTYLSIVTFVIAISLPAFLEVSEYFSWIIYLAGLIAFYMAGYKTWKESLPDVINDPLLISADIGTIKFSVGTGNVFKNCKLHLRLSISNNTNSAAALDNFYVTLQENVQWLSLKNPPKLVWGTGENVSRCAEIGPKESKMLDVILEGEGTINDRVKLAKAFRKCPVVPAKLTSRSFIEGEQTEINVECQFDAKLLIESYKSGWKKSNLLDALNELEAST